MLKKINFNTIIVITFCIVLMYCFLLVGSPVNNNVQIINVLFNIITIIVIILNYKKNKELKFTKIEIVILGLILAGFIPIIFRTQATLNSTIDSILKYITILNIFIILKYILKTDKKYLYYISNTVIIASVLLVIFGIDMMNNNIFENLYKFLNTVVITNSSSIRMDSLYEYPNTFAMFLGIAFILSIGNIISLIRSDTYKSKKNELLVKIILYIITCFIQAYGIIMSGSRLSLLILLVIMILWCILERKKIFSKKIIIIISCIIAFVILMIILSFTINIPLVLFNETKEEKSQYVKQINNIKPNTEYNFDFEISSFNKTKDNNKFKIIVRQLTEKAEKICEDEISFDTFDGTKNINLVTKENTDMIRICFISKETIKEKTNLEIKNLTMNGQKLKLNYLFIPISFANRIENIGINESSITERFVIIKDGIKLAMQNFFTGLGNDGWYYNYTKAREYNYGATQMHNYIVDLFIQDGIIGLLLILILFVLLIFKIVKIIIQKQNEYYPIILATIFGFIHALFDFDMNFYAVLVLMFMLVAIIDNSVKEKYIITIKDKIIRILGLLLMILILIVNTGSYIAYKIDMLGKNNEFTYKNWEEKINEANIKIHLAPYNYEYLSEKIQIETVAKNSSHIKINERTYKSFTEELIKMLENVTKNEQGRYDISESYRRLIINYLDNMNENNVDDTLEKIEKNINKVEDKNELYGILSEIVQKLEGKYKDFQDEKIQTLCNKIYTMLGELETELYQYDNL